MNGLLGSVDDPRTAGLLGLGLRLMSTPGKFGQALGSAGLGAMGDMRQAQASQDQRKRAGLQEQLTLLQLEQVKAQQEAAAEATRRQKAIEGAYGGAIESPAQQALAGGGGPTVANATAMQGMQPRLNQSKLIEGLMRADPMTAAKMLMPQPGDYKVVGNALVQTNAPGGPKPVYEGQQPTDKDVALLKMIHGDGTPAFTAALAELGKKRTTHAPAPSATVINGAKPMVNEIAGGLGKQIDNSFANAQAAVPSIQTAHTLRAAVDTGKIVSGPGAKFRVFGLQVGQLLGVGGKDGAEVLANTRTAIQSMAQAELSAAEQMKGQGQITEAERSIIRRAAAGDINELTAPEIRLLSEVMEKTARFKIGRHKKNVDGLSKVPGAEALLPFYQLDEPPQYNPQGAVRRYNPATGKIE